MSERLHAWLVRRYPREFRARFAASMERDFADVVLERRGTARPILDTALGAVRENMMSTRPIVERPVMLALLGLLFAVPLLVLNHLVVFRIDPVFSLVPNAVIAGVLITAFLLFAIALGHDMTCDAVASKTCD